tara:strand:+ start:81 stop:221 length:141 start_codon:yes stop_codon:yes gene_type:complete
MHSEKRNGAFRDRIDDLDRPMKMNLLKAVKKGMAWESKNFVPELKK